MFRKIIFILLFIILLSPRCLAFANVEINEIMYDLKTGSDDGREWVEIYNNNNIPVDFSSFRFFEADTNHKIKLMQGDANIPAQGYALIVSNPVKFKIDWPSLFTGPIFVSIFDSSFSLNNDGEVLMLKDKNLNIIDQYTYKSSLGGAGDGNSLQKINGVWLSATPTPGAENIIPRISFAPPPLLSVSSINKSEPISQKVFVEQNKPNKITIKEMINEPNIPVENLGAQVVESNIEVASNSSYIFITIFVLLLGVCTGVVYFIRRKKIIVKAGDDFKILNE